VKPPKVSDSTSSTEIGRLVPMFASTNPIDDREEPTLHLLEGPSKRLQDFAASMAELRKLVHSYTSSPREARPLVLAKIEELSGGYVITPPVHSLDQTPSSVETLSKADLFVRLAPDLKRMDKSKQDTSKMTQQITSCCVGRGTTGRIRYHHVLTNRKIRPNEYEQRYILMLDEITRIKSDSWAKYFRKIKHETVAVQLPQREQHGETLSDTMEVYDAKPMSTLEASGVESSSSSEMIATLPLLQSSPLTKKSRNSSEDKSRDERPRQDSKGPASSFLSDGGASPRLLVEGASESKVNREVSPFSSLLLSSREQASDDQQIARAEAKLWEIIDQALNVYSKEVLEIQRARALSKATLSALP
jgi:hypothetical protein